MTARSKGPLCLLSLFVALALTTGCSSSRVYANQDPDADFGAYRTYGFAPTLGTDKDEYSSLLSQYLKTATSRELEARGYRLDEEPDLLVNFYVQTAEKVDTQQVPTNHFGYSHSPGWGGYTGYMGYETVVTQYTEGTLVVDLVDNANRRLIWEGALVGRVSESVRQELEKNVNAALAEVFAMYPYVAGSSEPVPED